MKTKWTPGPWKNHGMLIFGNTGAVAIIADPEAETTDDIKPVGIGCQRWDDAVANARLIAACPLLLADLKEAEQALRSTGVVILADKYAATIAKAEGAA